MNVLDQLRNKCESRINQFQERSRAMNEQIIEAMSDALLSATCNGNRRIKFQLNESDPDLHLNQIRHINDSFRHQAGLKCSYDKRDRVFTLTVPY